MAARQGRPSADAPPDQRHFRLHEAASEAFAQNLTDPPAPSEALQRLCKKRLPWE